MARVPGRARTCGTTSAGTCSPTRQVELAREAGALARAPARPQPRASAPHLFAGELAAAAALIEEADAVTEATGSQLAPVRRPGARRLARRARPRPSPLIEADRDQDVGPRRGHRRRPSRTGRSALLLQRPRPLRRGAGRRPSRPASTRRRWPYLNWALPELIEAAARSGSHRARRPPRSSGSSEIDARQRHRLGAGHRGALARAAERRRRRRALYREAIERLGRTRVARRARPRAPALRRVAAPRAPARRRPRAAAHRPRACSAAMGTEAFAERARRELLATGETVRKRTRRDARRAHRAGGADRAARPRRAVEPGDRRPAVHQPAHRRVAPAQGVHQARHQLPPGARDALPRSSSAGTPRTAHSRSAGVSVALMTMPGSVS